MLSEAQQRVREFKTTASQAPVIMSGDNNAVIKLWRERIGEIEPEDLSRNWPVQLGSFLETFILDWHEQKTGTKLMDRGLFHPHPSIPDIGATLDAWRSSDDTVIDAKVAGAWRPIDDVVAYYVPQIIVQMRCRPARNGALLICHGGAEPREIAVVPDPDYETEMWARLAAFELCVKTLRPPSPLPRIVPPDQWRSFDLNNLPGTEWPNWAHEVVFQLLQWRELRPMAAEFEDTAGLIKSLIPDDVGRLTYGILSIHRNRRGSLTIKDTAQ